MDPDVGVTKSCDSECCVRVEANGDGPKQKEGKEVHAVTRESKDSFVYEGHVTVSRIEMVGTSGPNHSEVSPDAVHSVDSGQCEESCYDINSSFITSAHSGKTPGIGRF